MSRIYKYLDVYTLPSGKKGYRVMAPYVYISPRYNKTVVCPIGMTSDGATGAIDIDSMSWIVHDRLCDTGMFEDGTPCTNWQASMILSDILEREGRHVRKFTWLITTFLFGGGKARDNGMF